MNQLVRDEIDYQQRRFYRRLKMRGRLVVEFWPGAKKFLNSIPGIAWEKQGNKILIREKINTMKTFRDILTEGKKKYEIRKAGDGYVIRGPLKPGQTYDKGPRVDNAGVDDGLFDNQAQAEKHVKKIGGELRSAEETKQAHKK
jgi:hypothetical protein